MAGNGTVEVPAVDIDIDLARAILAEATSGGFMVDPIPADDDEAIKEAQYWYSEAFKAELTGMAHDTIITILNLVASANEPNQGGGSDYNPGYARTDPVENAVKVEENILTQQPEDPNKLMKEVNLASKHNLPVPKDWQGDPEHMPRDISELSDKDIRRLSGEFNAYLSRAKWLLAIAVSDLSHAEFLRDAAYRRAITIVDKVDKKTDKNKLKEVLDAEVREDPEFASYDAACLKHKQDVTTLKALVDIYGGNVDRLSREWTMRTDEYERSR